MEIKKKITKVNCWKGDGAGGTKQNKYINIHYVGAVSSAKNNADYFYEVYRGVSAHYFVDDNEIYQVVEDSDSSWGVSAKTYYNGSRNTNSINIEMCCFMNNGKLDISEKTINNTIELVKTLMSKYGIPASNVVRHYDVTRKICPAPFVSNPSRWDDFKSKLGGSASKPAPARPSGEAVDQILHVGSKIVLNDIYKISAVSARLNAVACVELADKPFADYNYIDATPCIEVDRYGNRTSDQVCDVNHYIKIPGVFTVLAIDKPTDACKVKIGSREVWIKCGPCTEV